MRQESARFRDKLTTSTMRRTNSGRRNKCFSCPVLHAYAKRSTNSSRPQGDRGSARGPILQVSARDLSPGAGASSRCCRRQRIDLGRPVAFPRDRLRRLPIQRSRPGGGRRLPLRNRGNGEHRQDASRAQPRTWGQPAPSRPGLERKRQEPITSRRRSSRSGWPDRPRGGDRPRGANTGRLQSTAPASYPVPSRSPKRSNSGSSQARKKNVHSRSLKANQLLEAGLGYLPEEELQAGRWRDNSGVPTGGINSCRSRHVTQPRR